MSSPFYSKIIYKKYIWHPSVFYGRASNHKVYGTKGILVYAQKKTPKRMSGHKIRTKPFYDQHCIVLFDFMFCQQT